MEEEVEKGPFLCMQSIYSRELDLWKISGPILGAGRGLRSSFRRTLLVAWNLYTQATGL